MTSSDSFLSAPSARMSRHAKIRLCGQSCDRRKAKLALLHVVETNPREVLTREEAAVIFGISRNTLRDLGLGLISSRPSLYKLEIRSGNNTCWPRLLGGLAHTPGRSTLLQVGRCFFFVPLRQSRRQSDRNRPTERR